MSDVAAILLVDDELDILTTTTLLLSMHGFAVDGAPDGHIAWEKLQAQRFDIIITDWAMPHVDGVQLAQRVRSTETLRDTRIIMSSAAADAPVESSGVIDAYLRKPVYFFDLLDVINGLLAD
jgi:DNA-binding response OmpR family regulator